MVIPLILLFCVSIPIFSMAQTDTAVERENTLVIGVISSNPQKAFKRAQPIATYLAENLSSHNIQSARIEVAKNITQMARWLENGHVDIVSESIFPAYELHRRVGASYLARRWKSGSAEYSSIFFTSNSSGVESFDDLLGKVVVFEDRGSTSAFIIPASILLEKGYQLYELSSPREVPPEDKIGYLFADELSKLGGETNMMSWVHNKIVASAAFSNLDWDRQVPQQIKNNLNIFYQSRSVPRAIMVAAPNLNPDLKEELKKILLTAHESAEGKRALYAYKRTEKFDEITPEILHTLEWVGALRVLIETNLLF